VTRVRAATQELQPVFEAVPMLDAIVNNVFL